MEQKFFVDNDNFEDIIKSHFPSAKNLSQVQTGWTNFVFKAETDSGNFYFRFPRNDFFSDALLKEYGIVDFVKNKITFKTPDFKLFYDNGRPYTIHAEIEGESLSDCYNDLSDGEKRVLAKDVCKLLEEFENINLSSDTDIKFQKVSNFLDNLSNVSQNNYDLTVHNKLKSLEKQHSVFAHGDFNPGNLILQNHKLVAIIDFAFAGVSNELVDISRLIGRCPSEFYQILTEEYQSSSKKKINKEDIDSLLFTWRYVEEKYILYIKENHPSIVLPTLV